MNDFTISGTMLAVSGLAAVTLILALILICKRYINQRSQKMLETKKEDASTIVNRNKYAAVNVFRWSNTFLNVGLSLAIALVVLAFSWTSYEEPVDISGMHWDEGDLIVEIPRTATPPPPPPPPPPPVIEEVPEEEIDEEEEIEFVDTTIDDETEVILPPTPVAKTPPPPPPPPPVVENNIIEHFSLIEDKPIFKECEGIEKEKQEQCFTEHLLKYVYGEVKYPAIARENGVEGNVFIKFVIEKTGKIGAIEVLRSPSSLLTDETLRVINKLKEEVTFIPGMQRKRPVRVQFTMPVKYHLN